MRTHAPIHMDKIVKSEQLKENARKGEIILANLMGKQKKTTNKKEKVDQIFIPVKMAFLQQLERFSKV